MGLLFFTVVIEANLFPIVNNKTVCTSTKPCELKWVNDANPPSLFKLPKVNIKLMVGPNNNQIEVRDLGTVAPTVGKIVYKIPVNLGPPGRFYFYKFSAGVVDVWSTRFTIKNIKGDIEGFDPQTVNANGDVVNKPKGDDTSTVTNDNSTNPVTLSDKNGDNVKAASSINSPNNLGTIGLSMIVMIAVSYLC